MSQRIPLFKIYWDTEDCDSVINTISSGSNWAIGPNNEKFEDEISRYFGKKYCATFNSGTSALHSTLIAYGIQRGDEVIVPSFTFIATANAPKFVGAKPVFADIEEETYGLNPDDVRKKITSKTKAIIPIHFGGCPCKIEELKEIADDNKLILIEDAAEAFGAKVKNTMIGTFGDSALLSFCQNKIITTGEGGAIVTDSRELFEKLKLIRSHGRLETCDYFSTSAVLDYVQIGYNFRLSSILASLGLSQMHKVNSIISMRQTAAAYYTKKLREIPGITPLSPPKDYHGVYQLFSIRVKKRDALIKFLETKGIASKIYFPPIHFTSFYQKDCDKNCSLPVTEKVSAEILSLPFYPQITKDEMDYVVETIQVFQGKPNGA